MTDDAQKLRADLAACQRLAQQYREALEKIAPASPYELMAPTKLHTLRQIARDALALGHQEEST